MPTLQLSTFSLDVTPPLGHPLCAGWYGRAVALADRLKCTGVILTGSEKPVALVAIDFCEMSNDSHLQWRTQIAQAIGTDADRVAIQCMHAHCSPWPDVQAQHAVAPYADVLPVTDLKWDQQTLSRIAKAASDSLSSASPLTHMEVGQAAVHRVASNRRCLGPDGKVKHVRYTKMKDPAVINEPQGLIDPILRSISFWNGDRKRAVLFYYTVHPTSQDQDHTITPDFAGLARDKRQAEAPDVLHLYFTGCAGNITAGKYNTGDIANRPVLRDRVYDAMVTAEAEADRFKCDSLRWQVEPVVLPPRADLDEAALRARIADAKLSPQVRNHAAIPLAYLLRKDRPIPITCLTLGDRVKILNLPGETFVEYQLEAQLIARGHVVLTASYGDCGPGYICLARSFDEGGYEPSDSFVAPESEDIIRRAIRACILG